MSAGLGVVGEKVRKSEGGGAPRPQIRTVTSLAVGWKEGADCTGYDEAPIASLGYVLIVS